jgi:hypothetical protein
MAFLLVSGRRAPLIRERRPILTLHGVVFEILTPARRNATHSASMPRVNALAAVLNYSTGTTSTATPSFCLREPTMMPSTGETSEKSRPMARMM